MAVGVNDLKVFLSGGAANTSPAASLGGIVSTAGNGRVRSQSASLPVNVTGIVITDAFGNAVGAGTLQYTSSPKTLQWKPFGATSFYSTPTITADGEFVIGSSLGYLVATVTFASLPASNKIDTITISQNVQNVFDHVTAAQSLAGKTSYRCLYVKNAHATDTAFNVRLWVKQNTPAEDEIDIGLDPIGVGNGSTTGVATTIANELAVPAGVVFSHPITQVAGLFIGDLLPGQVHAFWQKRIVPIETRGTVIGNTSILAISADL